MIDITTSRLILHAIDETEARRISAAVPGPDDQWAKDYPFAGDLAAVGMFIMATEQLGEQRPFGYYQIITGSDGSVVGGVGFKGPPGGVVVEIGYGLAPSARGHGYAGEALRALLDLAAEHGITTVLAETTPDNVASRHTLRRAGFVLVSSGPDVEQYAIALT